MGRIPEGIVTGVPWRTFLAKSLGWGGAWRLATTCLGLPSCGGMERKMGSVLEGLIGQFETNFCHNTEHYCI
jgi:hypothetical protein